MGRTLLAAALIPVGAVFVSGAVVATLGSPRELGLAEAARIVASPVLVFGTGIRLVIRPRLLEAGHARSWGAFRVAALEYTALIGGGGAVYTVLVSWNHALNPMAALVPAAYVLGGLVAMRAASATVMSVPFAPYMTLVGARDHRALVRAGALAAAVGIGATSAAAPGLGAYALPIGGLASSALFTALLLRRARATLTRA